MRLFLRLRNIGALFLLSFVFVGPALAVQPTSTTGLTGTWYNANPNTRGTVKVVVWTFLGNVYVRTYGACTPTPCDHGTRVAKVYSRSISSNYANGLTADWNHGFKTTRVDARREYGIDGGTFLRLNSFHKFAAGDTRKDYFASEVFYRR